MPDDSPYPPHSILYIIINIHDYLAIYELTNGIIFMEQTDYTIQSQSFQIGVKILVSDIIGVRVCYYKQIIRQLLNVLLIISGVAFCYLLCMSVYNFYTYIK